MSKSEELDQEDDQMVDGEKPKPRGRGAKNSEATVIPSTNTTSTLETEKNVTEIWTERAKETQKDLEAQPKVMIMIPLQNGEPQGSVQDFNINGYRITVRKNVMVSVPQQIAQMIAERYQVEYTAGADMRIDRPKQGLQEALG